jgi:hypothetical protein
MRWKFVYLLCSSFFSYDEYYDVPKNLKCADYDITHGSLSIPYKWTFEKRPLIELVGWDSAFKTRAIQFPFLDVFGFSERYLG